MRTLAKWKNNRWKKVNHIERLFFFDRETALSMHIVKMVLLKRCVEKHACDNFLRYSHFTMCM